jgi:periplasmic protein TonB
MPLALLLSPDDQAVSAITAVLEEMSVTCERPLDGVSAAKKLNSHNFDLVLVDCENLPAAKLIFDVCRRGTGAHSPVPIAIVDGRAGLPTAFRLGAELILTKPVAKDQARTTIRAAVGRVKKDEPARSVSTETIATEESAQTGVSADSAPAAALLTSYESTSEVATNSSLEARAMAAAAPVHSAAFQESAPLAASPSDVSMSATVAVPEIKSAPVRTLESAPTQPKFESSEGLSEDPVLAELEKAESEPASAVAAAAPVFSAYAEIPKEQKKLRGPLIAVLVLALICAGLYAAWVTQPGFRAMAQPQVEQLLAITGIRHNSPSVATAPAPVKTATPAPPATAQTPENNQPVQTAADAGPSNGIPASGVAAPSASAPPSPGPGTATSAGATASSAAAPDKSTPADKTAVQNPSDPKTEGAVAPQSSVSASNEATAIILSSKGAEKRLIHSVQPKYPAGSAAAEGTVVLKAMVDESGKVTDAKVVEGNPTLVEAAVSAVKQWKYRPYLRDGKAIPFQTVVLIDFQRQ